MKRLLILAIISCVSIAAMAQSIQRVGVYKDNGTLHFSQPQSSVTVVLRVEKRHFTPGELARYAQKYLGVRASLASRTECDLLSATILSGSHPEQSAVSNEESVAAVSLPSYRTDGRVMTQEQQASSAAEMIFSLRKHRLDLITGEAGENVFGAGLKAALDEIARLEKECLDMFYGAKSVSEKVYTFNVTITPDKNEYMVCRFSDDMGIVAVDDLSGKPIVLKVETAPHKEYSDILLPLGPKDKVAAEYLIVPQSKCSLIGEATLMDTVEFASPLYGKSVTARPIK